MRTVAVAIAVLFLYGCAPSMIDSRKSSSYKETINTLAVVIAEPGDMKSTGYGTNTGAANSRASSAISTLNRVLRRNLASYFSEKGLRSDTVSVYEKDLDEYSHKLVITPSSASASCYYGKCQATVRIGAVLHDHRSKVIVWSASFNVPESTSFKTINDETAETIGELIWGAFQSENLLAATK